MAIVEADPPTTRSACGGLPNEDGVVELDAAVMHGPTHGGGSVASIRNIIHPAAVARLVMKRTRHCLLVGDGALRFARAHGFPEVNLLTDEARQIWLHWKETRDPNDDWVPPPDEAVASFVHEYIKKRVTGTIHCSVLDTHGDLGCTTTTSGLSWKIPGRVGDSPILGAGLFLDNEVGSAGSTGVGEANLLNLSSYLVVEGMRRGLSVKDAVMEACKRIADDQRSRPQAAAARRQDDVQRLVLRREQGRQVLRRLHLPRRQDGRPRRRHGSGRRPASRSTRSRPTSLGSHERERPADQLTGPRAEMTRSCIGTPSVRRSRSIRVGGDDFATPEGDEAAEGDDVDRVLEEPDAAVAHQDVDAAGVEREQLVVGAGVVARGDAGPGGNCQADCSYVGRNLLFGLPGDAVRGVGLGPPPVATAGRQVRPPAHVRGRAGHRDAVVDMPSV